MDIRELAELADLRQISPVLERNWESRTGKNPIVPAIKVARIKARSGGAVAVMFLAFATAFLGSILALALGLALQVMVIIAAVPGLMTMGILALMGAVVINARAEGRVCRVEDLNEAHAFARDLGSLLEWSKLTAGALAVLGPVDLKKLAADILIKKGAEIKNLPQDSGLDEKYHVEKARLTSEFKAMHLVLLRLLLVEEKWDRYFNPRKFVTQFKPAD